MAEASGLTKINALLYKLEKNWELFLHKLVNRVTIAPEHTDRAVLPDRRFR
ncbi:MAG: hypothetical protein GQF41_0529 [Candidatus Rifleibacterium amylolyticum]|nr:MAG: hypothetical protein GQF41_0529 [Candidatus Rifleibacterium amylolyticum]